MASGQAKYSCNILFIHTPAAGNAFRQAADIHMKLDTKHEAATHLVEGGQVLKKEDPNGSDRKGGRWRVEREKEGGGA